MNKKRLVLVNVLIDKALKEQKMKQYIKDKRETTQEDKIAEKQM